MNTEAIRAKFESLPENSSLTLIYEYDDIGDRYLRRKDQYVTSESREFTERWVGYQQAVKDMEAENKSLRAFPDFKVPSECVARFMGHNDPLEALNKAALVACGFNECREWFKARRGES